MQHSVQHGNDRIPWNDRDGKDDRRDYGIEKVKKIEQHREGSNPE